MDLNRNNNLWLSLGGWFFRRSYLGLSMHLPLAGGLLGLEIQNGFTHMSGTSAEMPGIGGGWLEDSQALCLCLSI